MATVPATVLRRRRLVAVTVLGVVFGVLTGVVVPVGSAAPVPSGTTVAVVGAGESLSDVADRVAPGADVETVAERIREVNGLDGRHGSALTPGTPLVVPAAVHAGAG